MARSLPNVVVLVALVLGPWSGSEAFAQQRPELPPIDFGVAAARSIGPIRLSELEQRPVHVVPPAPGAESSPALKSLYASTIITQALDVHSTMAVVNRGGTEGNPVMAGLVNNKAAFIGVKAAVAATTILAARKISKRSKTAAILTLVAVNSAYALVISHNYRVARSLQ
jgi:uncharacterized protein DUF5658